jgi:hypothetical protein
MWVVPTVVLRQRGFRSKGQDDTKRFRKAFIPLNVEADDWAAQ